MQKICRSAVALAAATARRPTSGLPSLQPRPVPSQRNNSSRPLLAAAAATAAATAAFAPATETRSESLAVHTPAAPLPPYHVSPMLSAVARADPNATQTLLALLSDPTQRLGLLDTGAVQAILAGLDATPAEPCAIRLSLVRALADLAEESSQSHKSLSSPGLTAALAALLKTMADEAEESWTAWLGRQFGMGGETPSTGPDLAAGQANHTARAVAALARNVDLHASLLAEASLLPALCRALHAYSKTRDDSAERADTLRALVTAVSALAKSEGPALVAAGAHRPLLQFAADSTDSALQTFAIAGIRNLARHPSNAKKDQWQVHREIVVAGLPEALVAALSSSTAQTRAFAAAAFADVMASRHKKAHLIRERLQPAYGQFARLLTDKDPAVTRAMSRAIPTICGSPASLDDRQSKHACFVTEGLAAALAEQSGPLVNGSIGRGEISALRIARAMCSSEALTKGMVERGLLEVLLKSAQRGRGLFWEESLSTLAAVAEWPEFAKMAIERGIMRSVLARPCLENNAKQTTALLARFARLPDHRVEIAHSGMNVILKSITARDDPVAVREAARALFNLSLDGVSKVMVSLRGGLVPLVRTTTSDDKKARVFAVATLAELSESFEMATKLVEVDALKSLLRAVELDPALSRNVARCFAQLSQVAEVHGALASSGAAEWAAKNCIENGGVGDSAPDVMLYSTVTVCNVAFSPGTARNTIRDSGVAGALAVIAAASMMAPLVMHSAKQGIRNLRGEDGVAMLPVEAAAQKAPPA